MVLVADFSGGLACYGRNTPVRRNDLKNRSAFDDMGQEISGTLCD